MPAPAPLADVAHGPGASGFGQPNDACRRRVFKCHDVPVLQRESLPTRAGRLGAADHQKGRSARYSTEQGSRSSRAGAMPTEVSRRRHGFYRMRSTDLIDCVFNLAVLHPADPSGANLARREPRYPRASEFVQHPTAAHRPIRTASKAFATRMPLISYLPNSLRATAAKRGAAESGWHRQPWSS